MTAISVDWLLALLLGFRYRQVVTLKRTCLIAIGCWIVSIVGSSTSFLNLPIVSLYNYIASAFCLVTTICVYTKIFMSLRHNQIHGQNHVPQSSQANTLNKARFRKAVDGALWVQVTLSSVRYSRSFNNSKGNVFIYLPCFAIHSYFSVFKLVVKSVAVLLEDHRSETSCKRNVTTTFLYQLRLRLRLMALRLPVINRRPESVVLACHEGTCTNELDSKL